MRTGPIDILIAEDNLSDAELILESLAAVCPVERVHIARDGVEALEFLFCSGEYSDRSCEVPPRLILLDIKLPKVDGLEVLQALKTNSKTRGIPVVVLTSSNLERDVSSAYRAGANSYLQKPIDFARFREVVRNLGNYWLMLNETPPERPVSEEER
jgi:two-component system response regulator